MICRYCGLEGHDGSRCNRPEGVASRGGVVIRMSDQAPTWRNAGRAGVLRGSRLGAAAASRRRRQRMASACS